MWFAGIFVKAGIFMFAVGDKIVCPLHGGGVVEDIISRDEDGLRSEVMILRIACAGVKITLPVASADSSNIRHIMTDKQAAEFLRNIPLLECEIDVNWAKRYRENMDKLKSGSALETAKVYKALHLRSGSKGLSAGERKMFHCARQVLISELSLSFGCEKDEAERRLLEVI